MHRKYLICCTTLYKYLETNISNYSNYFDNYSNVVKAFRLSTAFSSIYSFLLYVNDCMDNMQLVRPNDMDLCPQIIVTSSVTEMYYVFCLPSSWKQAS